MAQYDIGDWEGEIGAAAANAAVQITPQMLAQRGMLNVPRKLVGRPPILQAMPIVKGGGYESPTAVGLGFTTMGAAETTAELEAQCMAPFRPRRLVLSKADVAGEGGIAAGLMLVTRIDIGSNNILAGTEGIPIEAFSAESVGPQLVPTPCQAALPIKVTFLRTAAPGQGNSVQIAGVMFGEAL